MPFKKIDLQATNDNKNYLKILYTNSDSLRNKLNELNVMAQDKNANVIFVTEAMPKNFLDDFNPKVELNLENYNLYLNTNPKRGIVCYTTKSLKANSINITNCKLIESNFIEINHNNSKTLFWLYLQKS